MYFTQDDLRKIEEYIRQRGKKDSSFIEEKTIKEEDYVIILQDGFNVKVPVKVFLDTLKTKVISKAWLDDLINNKVEIPSEEWNTEDPVNTDDECCEEIPEEIINEILDYE